MMNKIEFFNRVKNFCEIKSKTGKATYNKFYLSDNILTFKRVEMETIWSLNLLELFELHTKELYFNTSDIKAKLKHRTNTPSSAEIW